MAKVELKQPVVQEIADHVDGAQSVVVVDYRGLTVAQDTQLRKELREAGVVYKVYKNTLMRRAFEGTDFAALDPCWKDPARSQFPKMMRQLRRESLQSLQRQQTLLRSRPVLWKAVFMMQKE